MSMDVMNLIAPSKGKGYKLKCIKRWEAWRKAGNEPNSSEEILLEIHDRMEALGCWAQKIDESKEGIAKAAAEGRSELEISALLSVTLWDLRENNGELGRYPLGPFAQAANALKLVKQEKVPKKGD
jgi:hypothetical protein